MKYFFISNVIAPASHVKSAGTRLAILRNRPLELVRTSALRKPPPCVNDVDRERATVLDQIQVGIERHFDREIRGDGPVAASQARQECSKLTVSDS